MKVKGYLKRHVYHHENGEFLNEYVLNNEPDDCTHTYFYDANRNITRVLMAIEQNGKFIDIEKVVANVVSTDEINKPLSSNDIHGDDYNESNLPCTQNGIHGDDDNDSKSPCTQNGVYAKGEHNNKDYIVKTNNITGEKESININNPVYINLTKRKIRLFLAS